MRYLTYCKFYSITYFVVHHAVLTFPNFGNGLILFIDCEASQTNERGEYEGLCLTPEDA